MLESALPLDTKSARRRAVVESFRRRLLCAAAENLVKAGFNPAQPRVPAGDAEGGQWTAGGGGGGRSRAPSGGGRGRGTSFVPRQPRRRVEGGIVPEPSAAPKKPKPLPAGRPGKPLSARDIADRARRINQNAPSGLPPELLEVDPITKLPNWYAGGVVSPTWSPLDFIGVPTKPVAGVVAREARVVSRLRTLRRERGDSGALTKHGSKRFRQRVVSDKDIDEAVKTAIRTGNVTTKRGGRHNQWQTHYRGSNGLTVIIAEEGRNKGRAITLYGKKPGGKF